jgi:hypothetical protein
MKLYDKVKKKYWKTPYNFGRLNKEDGADLWSTIIQKKMSKAKVAYIAIDGATPEQVRTNKLGRSGLPGDKMPYDILCQNGLYQEG